MIFFKVTWTHSSQTIQNIAYLLEYGVGSKIAGNEQFRRCYHGTVNCFTLNDLQPKTNYRLRVCAVHDKLNAKDKENHDVNKGEWSDVLTLATQEMPSVDKGSLGNHADFLSKNNENIVVFHKSGVVVGTNPFLFGVGGFEVKLELQSAHHSAEDLSCIKLGLF